AASASTWTARQRERLGRSSPMRPSPRYVGSERIAAGGPLLRLPRRAVLVQDRHEDQGEGDEPYPVDVIPSPRQRRLGDAEPVDRDHHEGQREEREEAVAGVLPEAQEEE